VSTTTTTDEREQMLRTRRQWLWTRGGAVRSTLPDHSGLVALQEVLRTFDRRTAEHCQRVAAVAEALGAKLLVSAVEREAVVWAARLHDLGKVGVPPSVLAKRDPLTDADWVALRCHPAMGAAMVLALSPDSGAIADGIHGHHERWDGSGYPDRLVGEDIPMTSRIVGAADTFDAMTHRRSYRSFVFSVDEAMAEIAAGSGSSFDPRVVEALVDLAQCGSLAPAA
jgi:HD-GYP domain-containing protein (c-di-GMP phosphodiesterase class II)